MSKGAFKQVNGKWCIDTSIMVNGTRKHFHKSGYNTMSEARSDFEIQRQLFIQRNTVHHEALLFDDLINEYKEMRKNKVRVTTLVCDNSIYNVYLLPTFSGKLIKAVFNPSTIKAWYNDLMTSNISDNKKSKVITLIKDLLKFSYNNRYIDAEMYQQCDTSIFQVKNINKKAKQERTVWTDEEQYRFIKATEENARDNLMFRTFLMCATRLGEFLAIKVSDFDYDNRRILITHQVVNITGLGQVSTDKLKSQESYRTIIISQELADDLYEYVNELKLKPENYLFFSCSGKNLPLGRTTFRSKLYNYCEKANVPKLVPHAVRHTMAVKLASGCETTEDIEICASRLGHTPSVFLNTYANHKSDDKQARLMSKLIGI